MSTAVLIPVEEYLSSVYEPECDYVDGELEDRNVGEKDHSVVQKRILRALSGPEDAGLLTAFPEVRVQVRPTRFRVPDVCVYRGSGPDDQIFRTPPFLCIEILSPEDRMTRMQRKLDDYLAFGVEFIWVIDPERRAASICTAQGLQPVQDGLLRTANPDIAIRLEDVLA